MTGLELPTGMQAAYLFNGNFYAVSLFSDTLYVYAGAKGSPSTVSLDALTKGDLRHPLYLEHSGNRLFVAGLSGAWALLTPSGKLAERGKLRFRPQAVVPFGDSLLISGYDSANGNVFHVWRDGRVYRSFGSPMSSVLPTSVSAPKIVAADGRTGVVVWLNPYTGTLDVTDRSGHFQSTPLLPCGRFGGVVYSESDGGLTITYAFGAQLLLKDERTAELTYFSRSSVYAEPCGNRVTLDLASGKISYEDVSAPSGRIVLDERGDAYLLSRADGWRLKALGK